VDGERQSGVGESSTVVAGRGGNELLIRTDSERIRRTGQRLHALRVEAGRQVARSGCSAGAVGTQCWHRQYSGQELARLDCEPTGTVAMAEAQFSLQN
jgi:hypothetical protein